VLTRRDFPMQSVTSILQHSNLTKPVHYLVVSGKAEIIRPNPCNLLDTDHKAIILATAHKTQIFDSHSHSF